MVYRSMGYLVGFLHFFYLEVARGGCWFFISVCRFPLLIRLLSWFYDGFVTGDSRAQS